MTLLDWLFLAAMVGLVAVFAAAAWKMRKP
jgi:hypothetical protein